MTDTIRDLRAEMKSNSDYLHYVEAERNQLRAELAKWDERERNLHLVSLAQIVDERDQLRSELAECQAWRTGPDGVKWYVAETVAAVAELTRVREELSKACNYLREVGDDYPRSSCHKWCHEKADECTALAAGKGEATSADPRRR